MKTVRSLLDDHWYERYKRISRLNIRSSIYDVTDQCNLRCKGCFFFSSGEHRKAHEEKDINKWNQFVAQEKKRGVNLAILIGGEPTLYPERIAAFYDRLPSYCATNGQIKIDRDRFRDLMIGISLWGDSEIEKQLRGKDTFSTSLKNYAGDPCTYFLFTISPRQLGSIEPVVQRIVDAGLKVHMQLLSNDESVSGFDWNDHLLQHAREEMDMVLDRNPRTVISSHYYHKVITTRNMLGRTFGWHECPSVTVGLDDRTPQPKRLIRFVRWASDLKSMHRCCTSETRDCSTCMDGAAHMSWIMVNKRAHMCSSQTLQDWISVYEMFAKLYRFIPW